MKPDQEEKDPNLDEERQQYGAYAAATCRKDRQPRQRGQTDSEGKPTARANRQRGPARQWIDMPLQRIMPGTSD